jgi:hypothetical protein
MPAVAAGDSPYSYATLALTGTAGIAMSPSTAALTGVAVLLRIVPASGTPSAWMDANAANNNQNVGSWGGSSGAPMFTNGAAALLNTAAATPPTATLRPLLLPNGTGAVAATVYVCFGFAMDAALAMGPPSLTWSASPPS